MELWLIAIIVLAAAFAAASVLFLVGAALSGKSVFGKRSDKNPLLKYYTAEDFGLNAEPVTVKSGKTDLNGFLYNSPHAEQNGKLIVFCHGMGPGHVAYTTEIAYFCNHGFAVLAIDNSGCNLSGGDMKGMYSGVQTAVAALSYARATFNGKIYLVGHSWGGYSALCASTKVKADGVVAISAPDTPAKTMASGAEPIIGKLLATILRPFWGIVNFFKFGFNGNKSAGKSATQNATPTLLIHGDRDIMVNLSCSAYKKAKGAHVKKYFAKGKAHNPYNTAEAEKKLGELTQMLVSKATEEEKRQFFNNFDFAAATKEDEEVMQTIANFLK